MRWREQGKQEMKMEMFWIPQNCQRKSKRSVDERIHKHYQAAIKMERIAI